MASLTWTKVHAYRWNCNELPAVCISAAKVEGEPVYTLWQGSEAVSRSLNSRECKNKALELNRPQITQLIDSQNLF